MNGDKNEDARAKNKKKRIKTLGLLQPTTYKEYTSPFKSRCEMIEIHETLDNIITYDEDLEMYENE